MEDNSEVTHDEAVHLLKVLAHASQQHLHKGQAQAADPYDGYVLNVVERLWDQFEDLPVALVKGYDILNAELAKPPREQNHD